MPDWTHCFPALLLQWLLASPHERRLFSSINLNSSSHGCTCAPRPAESSSSHLDDIILRNQWCSIGAATGRQIELLLVCVCMRVCVCEMGLRNWCPVAVFMWRELDPITIFRKKAAEAVICQFQKNLLKASMCVKQRRSEWNDICEEFGLCKQAETWKESRVHGVQTVGGFIFHSGGLCCVNYRWYFLVYASRAPLF